MSGCTLHDDENRRGGVVERVSSLGAQHAGPLSVPILGEEEQKGGVLCGGEAAATQNTPFVKSPICQALIETCGNQRLIFGTYYQGGENAVRRFAR